MPYCGIVMAWLVSRSPETGETTWDRPDERAQERCLQNPNQWYSKNFQSPVHNRDARRIQWAQALGSLGFVDSKPPRFRIQSHYGRRGRLHPGFFKNTPKWAPQLSELVRTRGNSVEAVNPWDAPWNWDSWGVLLSQWGCGKTEGFGLFGLVYRELSRQETPNSVAEWEDNVW